MDQRNGVARRVDGAAVGRVVPRARRGRLFERPGRAVPQLLPTFAGPLLRERLRDRDFDEPRIAAPSEPVFERQPLRLGDEVDELIPQRIETREIELFEDVQHLEHDDALGREGRLVDVVAAVAGVQWRLDLGAMGGEVTGPEEATGRLARPADDLAEPAPVERRALGFGDLVERAGEARPP